MKMKSSRTMFLGILLLFSTMLNLQRAHAQTPDSISHSSTSSGAIQFQLIGGIGIYYIGDWSPVSRFRIGADVSLNHSNQSGGGLGYSIDTEPLPSSSSSSNNTSQPEETSNSYQISLSGLCLENFAEYKHTSIYCGIGPMVSYSWSRSTSNYPRSNYGTYDTSKYIDNNEYTNRASAIGPIAIFGVRSRLLDHVALSAEIGLSALYQWSMQSNSYTSTYSSQTSPTSTFNNGNISHLKGWVLSLNDIRIGLIIEL
jgi:hypothetical protein